MGDTINVSWKTVAIFTIIILLLFGTFAAFFGMLSDNRGSAKSDSPDSSQDIPEKCRLPGGQDVNSWKEHLGHHPDTQECLQYFD